MLTINDFMAHTHWPVGQAENRVDALVCLDLQIYFMEKEADVFGNPSIGRHYDYLVNLAHTCDWLMGADRVLHHIQDEAWEWFSTNDPEQSDRNLNYDFNNQPKEGTTMNPHPIIDLLSDAYVAWDVNHSWLVLSIQPKDEESSEELRRGFVYETKLVRRLDPVMDRTSVTTLYFATNQYGMVRFFAHDKENQNGFGGASFELELVDGTFTTIIGPWSSSPTCMMEEGFAPCDDVVVLPSTSTNMTFEAMQAVIDRFCPGFKVGTECNGWADDGPEHINFRRPLPEYNRIWPITGKPLSYKDGIARRRNNGDEVTFHF